MYTLTSIDVVKSSSVSHDCDLITKLTGARSEREVWCAFGGWRSVDWCGGGTNSPTVKRQRATVVPAVRHQNDEGEATLVKRHQL